jgi:hypothetical protein
LITKNGKRFLVLFFHCTSILTFALRSVLFWGIEQCMVAIPFRNSTQTVCPIPRTLPSAVWISYLIGISCTFLNLGSLVNKFLQTLGLFYLILY